MSSTVLDASFVRAGCFALTTRAIGKGGRRIPAGEIVGVHRVNPGTPPKRLCNIVWIAEDEKTQARATVPEHWLRVVEMQPVPL